MVTFYDNISSANFLRLTLWLKPQISRKLLFLVVANKGRGIVPHRRKLSPCPNVLPVRLLSIAILTMPLLNDFEIRLFYIVSSNVTLKLFIHAVVCLWGCGGAGLAPSNVYRTAGKLGVLQEILHPT